ncbi:MAG: CHAT domain-containing protein [Acidobacteria bacterium]|nr:CHAT domain-containing protein [Acidobacteriota bacterium]
MNHLRVLRATLCWAVLGLTGLGGVAAAPDADHVNEIMFLVGDNRLNEALEHAHLLMSQEPEDVRGYYYFTWVLAKLDRLAWGERYFLEKLKRDPDNAYYLFALGTNYRIQTDYPRAIEFLENAIARRPRQDMFFDIYLLAVDVTGEHQRALNFLLGLHRPDPDNCYLTSSIAELHYYLDDYNGFLRWEEIARAQNPEILATSILTITRYQMEGRDDKAMALARQRADEADRAGRLRDKAYYLLQISNLHLFANEYEQCRATADEAFSLCNIIGDEELKRYLERLYADYYTQLGDYLLAQEHYRNVLLHAEQIKHIRRQADIHVLLGINSERMGNLQGALDAYNQALVLSVKVQQRSSQVLALKKLADLKHRLNEYDDAEAFYQQALRMTREMSDPFTESVLESDLGLLDQTRKQHEAAMEHFRKSLDIADRMRLQYQKGVVLECMGWSLFKMDRRAEAYTYVENARRLFAEIRDDGAVADCDWVIGHFLYKQDQFVEALEQFQKVLAATRRLNSRAFEVGTLRAMGACYRKLGRTTEAIDHYQRALDYLEEIENSLLNYKERVGFGEDLFSNYESLIAIHEELYRRHGRAQDMAEAFRLSEKAKARNLSATIAQTRLLQHIGGVSPERNTEFLLLSRKLEDRHKLYTDLVRAGVADTDVRLLSVQSEIGLLERQRGEFLDRLRRENPRFFELLTPGFVSLDELRRRLPPRMAAVEFFVGELNTYYWLIRKDEVRFGTLNLTRDQLEALLRDVSFNLFSPRKVDTDGNFLRNQRWAGIRTKGMHELCRRLSTPWAEHLAGIDRLLIIPDHMLHYLPFEMLVDRWSREGEIRFWLDRFAISYLPYAGMINTFPSGSPPDARLRNVLLLGNPEFLQPDTASPSGGAAPVSLPWSEAETRDIYRLIPRSQLFLKGEATEKNFKANAGAFRVLHPSTHSYLDDRQPFYSRLVFASVGGAGGEDDGALYTYEIFNMKLDANLVVLSGCETGLGKLSRGEGIVGLNRAFTYAGAASLVMSLWPVGDRSTAKLMTEFYRQLWEGAPKSEALRAAKLAVARDPQSRDPFFWAPFILQGDPGPVPFRRDGWPRGAGWLLAVSAVMLLALGIWAWRSRAR